MLFVEIRERARSALHWVFEAEPIGEEPVLEDARQSRIENAAGDDEGAEPGEATPQPGAMSEKAVGGEKPSSPHPRLRFWVAMGLVVAAVSTAAGAWRAEIFMEYATQKDALARQALTGLQLSERNDEESAMSQLRQLGAYQQASLLTSQLQRQAQQSTGHAAIATSAQAQNEALIAAAEAQSFSSVFPTTTNGVATLAPAEVYGSALLYDPSLATFEPESLEAKASKARADAVNMAGVTVFFALTVVLLTLSEMMLRRRDRDPQERWSSGHALAVGSVVVWTGAFVLFALLYLDVPSLK